jgi:transcriptional regulator with XRE-family HTH domain
VNNAYFDTSAFMQEIDTIRKVRKLSWRGVCHLTGMDASHLSQFKTGKLRSMNVDTLASLTVWSGLDVRRFMKKYGETDK